MSGKHTTYPPESVLQADDAADRKIELVKKEICARYRIDRDTLDGIVGDLGAKLANLLMLPEHVATEMTGAGFRAVNYDHFRNIDNLRIQHFLEAFFQRAEVIKHTEHELGLLILEIKELRAELHCRSRYNWRAHRKDFPLIGQTAV